MLRQKISRRRVLKTGAVMAGVMAAQAVLPRWMPRVAFADPYDEPEGDILINVFLRGGADALNVIVPHGEQAYYDARPQLAIARPDANAEAKALDLDGFFGLHPALNPLLPIFQAGQMRAVHAAGSPHETRSHFEAMDYMERGTPGDYSLASGWIGRHLAAQTREQPSPVRGVGWGTALPMSLSGAPASIAMQSIVDYHLGGDAQAAAKLMQPLMNLYAVDGGVLHEAAQGTQAALEVIASVGYAAYQPQHGAQYPEHDFGMALRQTAALIRAQVGLEVVCIDLGGWDTHANQGGAEGTQANLLGQLADGLAAFQQDMSDLMQRISVVVMSEFGRRVEENASRGTDHGRGGAMLVMSGGLAAGNPVFADWRGLAPDVLDDGDVPMTTDYRDVLHEIVFKRLKNADAASVFPNYQPNDLGLFVPV